MISSCHLLRFCMNPYLHVCFSSVLHSVVWNESEFLWFPLFSMDVKVECSSIHFPPSVCCNGRQKKEGIRFHLKGGIQVNGKAENVSGVVDTFQTVHDGTIGQGNSAGVVMDKR